MLKDNLVQLGLTENEAKTYLFLTENIKAKASDVAKNIQVTHPAAKKILDSLIAKGIIRSQEYSKTTFYFPEDGEKIIKLAEDELNKAIQLNKNKLKLAEETSKLLSNKILLKKEVKTDICFLKGIEGIKELSNLISNSKNKKVLEFTDTELALYTKMKDNADYLKEYKAKNINFDVIYTNHDLSKTVQDSMIKIDPENVISPTAQMLLFDDKVAFGFVSDDHSIIVIENEWVANTLKTLFLYIKRIKDVQ